MHRDARTSSFDTTRELDPVERLIALPEPLAAPRGRFVTLLAFSLVFHAAALALLLSGDSAREATQEQEIAVEVVIEPPPEKKVEPPQPREEPPKEKVTLYEKPAFDAPRAANKERIEREAPDQETKAARIAPPTEQIAPEPAAPVKKPSPAQGGAPQASPQSAPQKQADDKPDAETLDKAAPAPRTKPEEKQAQAETKPSPTSVKKQTVADQIAAFAPLPDYQLGAAAKPAPVAGGTAKTTYLSILFGLIMRHMHVPRGVGTRPAARQGIVAFYIDEMGNLTHQAVFRASGQPDLDAAAIAAVRRAAPFPAPPRGYPHAIQFQYSTR